MRTALTLCVIALSFAPVVARAADGPAAPATAPAPRGRQEAAKERVAVCREALPLAILLYSQRLATVDQVGEWSGRLMDSLRDAEPGKAALAAALREHLAALKKFEAQTEAAHRAGLCYRTDPLTAKYFRLEAEQRLAEAEGR